MTNTTIDALNTNENIFNTAVAMQPAAEATPSKQDRRLWTVGNATCGCWDEKEEPDFALVEFSEAVNNTEGRPKAIRYTALVGSHVDMQKAAEVLNGITHRCVFDGRVKAIGYVGPRKEAWHVSLPIIGLSNADVCWAEPTPDSPEGGYFFGNVFVAFGPDCQEIYLLDGRCDIDGYTEKPYPGTDWLF